MHISNIKYPPSCTYLGGHGYGSCFNVLIGHDSDTFIYYYVFTWVFLIRSTSMYLSHLGIHNPFTQLFMFGRFVSLCISTLDIPVTPTPSSSNYLHMIYDAACLCFQLGDLLPIFSINELAFAAISTDLSVNGTRSGGVCEPVCIVPASFSIQSLAEIFTSIISSSESKSGVGARKGPPSVLTDPIMLLDSGANVNLFTNSDLISNIITNLTKSKKYTRDCGYYNLFLHWTTRTGSPCHPA